jgi:hypothetical protein
MIKTISIYDIKTVKDRIRDFKRAGLPLQHSLGYIHAMADLGMIKTSEMEELQKKIITNKIKIMKENIITKK